MVSMMVLSTRASDMLDRAGVVVWAGVAALAFILIIVPYHVINSVVYILHPLLRSILLLRQQMCVSNYFAIVSALCPELLLYNSC
jgi:hypothetical protein